MHLSTNGNATVNIEVVSSDVIGGRVESKETGHTGNLLGLSKSLEGDALGNLLQVILAELGSHVGLNETGAKAVDGDTTSGKLLGIAHGQTDDTTLGGGVVGLAGVADLSDDTGDVDDAAGALLGGNLEEGLGAVEDTGEVDVDDGLPLLWLHSHNEGVGGNAGVVDQDIAGAVLLHDLVEHGLDLIRIGAYTSIRASDRSTNRHMSTSYKSINHIQLPSIHSHSDIGSMSVAFPFGKNKKNGV